MKEGWREALDRIIGNIDPTKEPPTEEEFQALVRRALYGYDPLQTPEPAPSTELPTSTRHFPLGVPVTTLPEYGVWHGLKNRCYREVDKSYPDYGARGVKMCDEWRGSFVAFYRYVGQRPTPDHSIERIENDKDYEPGNVRWATRAEQVINKRNNRWLEYNGERFTLAQAAKKYGISTQRLYARLKNMPLHEALTTPLRHVPEHFRPRPNQRRLLPDQERELVTLYDGGHSKLSLAKRFHISTSTVIAVLNRAAAFGDAK